MSDRSAREDAVVVATRVRNDLTRAMEGLDVLLEDDANETTLSERRALRAALHGVLSSIRNLNDAPDLTGLTATLAPR